MKADKPRASKAKKASKPAAAKAAAAAREAALAAQEPETSNIEPVVQETLEPAVQETFALQAPEPPVEEAPLPPPPVVPAPTPAQPPKRAASQTASRFKAAPPPVAAPLPLWFYGFMGFWAVLPLPFGSNRPWASDLMGLLCAILLMVMTVTLWRKPIVWEGRPPYKRLAVSGLLIIGLVLWSWIQTVSWTPLTWHHPLWQEMSLFTGLSPDQGAISLNPSAFQESIVRFLSYVGCFFLALFTGRDSSRARTALRLFTATATVYAAYGLALHVFGIERILWFPKWMYEGFVTSTFVNKNSFATYTGLGFLASLALLWQQVKHRLGVDNSGFPINARLLQFFLRFQIKDLTYIAIPFVLFLALVLSGSRAGFFSTAAAALVFVTGVIINRVGFGWRFAAIGIVLLSLFGGFLAMSGDLLISRGQDLSPTLSEDADMRLRAYNLAGDAVMDNPWFGFGLGSFESAFRLYRNDSLPLRFQHAHNDYLEVAVEWGLPACAGLGLALLLLISCCLQGAKQRRRMEYIPLLGVSASVLVGLHALGDFSMQIPAIAATYAILLGLGVSQSWSSRAASPKS